MQSKSDPAPSRRLLAGLRAALYHRLSRLPRRVKQGLLLTGDLMLVPLALLAALALQVDTLSLGEGLEGARGAFVLLLVVAALAAPAMGMPQIKLNAYEHNAILRTAAFAALTTAAATGLSLGLSLGTGHVGLLPVPVFISFGLIYFLLIVAARLAAFGVLTWVYLSGQRRTPILIYGAGQTGLQLVSALRRSDQVEPVAFIDDNPSLQGMTITGLRVHGPAQVPDLVAARGIERVVLAMPALARPRQLQIARRLMGHGVDVHAVPSFAEIIGAGGAGGIAGTLKPVSPDVLLGRATQDRDLAEAGACYRGETILITGAGGSIGAEICRQLLTCRPKCLVLLDLSEFALYSAEAELASMAEEAGVRLVSVLGSVCDRALMDRVLAREAVGIVLHAAAYKHVPLVEKNPVQGLRNNVLGTRVMAEAARAAGVARFILVSTDKAVRPSNVMGASKRLAELIVQDLAARPGRTVFSMVRFGNVLGSSGSVIPLFQDQIARGGPVTLTHDDITRYFMTIPEAVQLVLVAGSYAEGGEVFMLDMGAPVQIRDLAVRMIEMAGFSVRDRDNPLGDIEIVTTGLRPGEKLHEELLIGADLAPTPHPAIRTAAEGALSELEMAAVLKDLTRALEAGDGPAARAVAERWVERPRRDRGLADTISGGLREKGRRSGDRSPAGS